MPLFHAPILRFCGSVCCAGWFRRCERRFAPAGRSGVCIPRVPARLPFSTLRPSRALALPMRPVRTGLVPFFHSRLGDVRWCRGGCCVLSGRAQPCFSLFSLLIRTDMTRHPFSFWLCSGRFRCILHNQHWVPKVRSYDSARRSVLPESSSSYLSSSAFLPWDGA